MTGGPIEAPPPPPEVRPTDGPIVEAPDRGPSTRSIPHLQEGARRGLTFFLVGILAVEILFALTATWLPSLVGISNMPLDTLKEIMTIVFGPTIALVGSAAGFYFGNRPSQGG
jgi:hypothetical protein